MKTIENRIKSLREDRDMTQSDVARAVGIDQRSLSNYETGKTFPDSNTVVALAEFFGVSCDYLLGVTDTDLASPKAVISEIKTIASRLDAIARYLNKF